MRVNQTKNSREPKIDLTFERITDLLRGSGQPWGMLFHQDDDHLPTADEMDSTVVRGTLSDGQMYLGLRLQVSTRVGGREVAPTRYAAYFVRGVSGEWYVTGEAFLGLPFVTNLPPNTTLGIARTVTDVRKYSNAMDYNLALLNELLLAGVGGIAICDIGKNRFFVNLTK